MVTKVVAATMAVAATSVVVMVTKRVVVVRRDGRWRRRCIYVTKFTGMRNTV